MEKLKLQTTDIVGENVKRIGELFPNCLTETKDENGRPRLSIDFDQLRQELTRDIVEGPEERYQFTWPDKRNAIRLANAPTSYTLRPVRDDEITPSGLDSKEKPYCSTGSVNFDTTENLYIEGDNLEVLKLLREDYLGKIKMIYIDPPYNTGNDFVYNDDFSQTADEYAENSGQTDEEGNRLVVNTESNGRFHTDWLNMIYPRLKVAKDLLSEDGVIFISIDNNEVENVIRIGCEIFGEHNYIGPIIVKSNPRGSMSTAEIANLHEYIIVFSRKRDKCCIIGDALSTEMESEYKYEDEIGRYRLLGLRMRGGFWRRTDRPKLYFPIYINPVSGSVSITKMEEDNVVVFPVQPSTNIEGTWRWSMEKIAKGKRFLIARQVVRDGQQVWDVFQKDYLERAEERRTKTKSIWDGSEVNYQNGTDSIKSLLGNSGIFDYSKPCAMLCHLMKIIKKGEDDVILDFFSGSATTAHAVMQLNAEDGGNRKFIMVQLPEETDEKSEARKAGYANICEIGKERIRRAGKKIKEESPLTTQDLDTGFRVLKLDTSNMEDVYVTPGKFTEGSLFANNIKSDRTEEDLLFQAMIELGIDLSSNIERTEIAGKTVWNVAQNYLLACFDEQVNETAITEIAKRQPQFFVMRDSSLANDQVADNFEQIWELYSKDTERRIM